MENEKILDGIYRMKFVPSYKQFEVKGGLVEIKLMWHFPPSKGNNRR
jgi:hypothetical protein